MLWMLRDRIVLTESESAKQDMVAHGFKKENIHIFGVGSEVEPISSLANTQKFDSPTILSLGSIRAMKRTLHQVRAFEIAKQKIPNLRLVVAGDSSGKYGKKVIKAIEKSNYRKDIDLVGRVSKAKKLELMRNSHIITVTSIKEGWGLIVTEANSQGTPAIVYNVSGLRDSVRHGITGLVTEKNKPVELARKVVDLLSDPNYHHDLSSAAWKWSKSITYDKGYADFLGALGE
jgi:glycosyltransferase involved in cell wall biosynthesis